MRRSRWVSVATAAAVVLAGLVAGLVAGGGAAEASTTTGAITVMVVSPQKKAIRNDFDIETALATVVTAGGRALVTKSPDANGRVTFSHVPAAAGYTILLKNAYGYSHYLQSRRTGVAVTAGHHVWVEVVAQRGGEISGTISGPPSGYTAGVSVQALDRTGRVVVSTVDDSDGSYLLEGLPSGDYTVEFDARRGGENQPGLLDYEWQFLSGAGSQGTTAFVSAAFVHVAAETAVVPATQLTDVDARLAIGHSLSGRVASSFPQDFHLNCQVHFVTTAVGSSFCTSMDSAGSGFSETVVPGDYRIEITRPSATRPGTVIRYWYAGEGVPPASSESGAALVDVDGTADVSVSMAVH